MYCSIEGCEKRHAAGGLCMMHYQRKRRFGRLETVRRAAGDGHITEHGYVLVRGEKQHRLAWEAANGPIPQGMCVHHVNGKRTDNRLENLRLMTVSEHMLLHHAERAGRAETLRAELCADPGCDRLFYSVGLCEMHYRRMRRARIRAV